MKQLTQVLFHSTRFLILVCLIIASSQKVIAQKNTIKLTAMTKQKVSFSYERGIGRFASLGIGVIGYNHTAKGSFFFGEGFFGEPPVYKNNGARFSTEARIYMGNNEYSLSGAYLGVSLSTGTHRLSRSDIRNKALTKAEGFGLKFGWQKASGPITFDMGLNFLNNSVKKGDKGFESSSGKIQRFNVDMDGFEPELYVGIGVAF